MQLIQKNSENIGKIILNNIFMIHNMLEFYSKPTTSSGARGGVR
jgi:hypothetical protein